MRILFVFSIALYCFSITSSLAEVPKPSAHPTKEIEHYHNTAQKEKKKLESDLKNLEGELEKKKREMLKIAKAVKENEKDLLAIENSIKDKENEQKRIEDSLAEDKKSISNLILALQRIRRVPTEAILASPQPPLQTAQSSLLLESTLPRIYQRADKLKSNLNTLQEIITDLRKDRELALALSQKLEIDQKKLSIILADRAALLEQTEKGIKERNIELNKISAQAKSLRDLVGRLEEHQKKEEQRKIKPSNEAAIIHTEKNARSLPTPIPKSGEAQIPVSGNISISYGKTDEIGAVSQGLHIMTRPNALVVAPMGGVVEYTGTFKGYGEIILLKHQKGYHSLIAGLGKIDTVVGRSVAAGEPIAHMGYGNSPSSPILYYELRFQGHPVNPSKKIAGIR